MYMMIRPKKCVAFLLPHHENEAPPLFSGTTEIRPKRQYPTKSWLPSNCLNTGP